jgi:hypothetical protein
MRYRFLLRGDITASALRPVKPISCEVENGNTRVEVEVRDDAHLYGVLEAIQRLGAHVQGFQEVDPLQNGR